MEYTYSANNPLPPTEAQKGMIIKMLRMEILFGKEEGIAYLTREDASELICAGARQIKVRQ